MSNDIRIKGIYGEDVSVLMGINNKYSLKELYDIIMNREINKERDFLTKKLEETISREFSLRTNKEIKSFNDSYECDKELPFMVSNINRKVAGENALLYCKIVKKNEEDEWEGEQIPPKEFFKVQHDLKINDADMCYIAALIGENNFLLKPVSRDNRIINIITDCEKDFWNTYAEKKCI